jgi:hypothetical protein
MSIFLTCTSETLQPLFTTQFQSHFTVLVFVTSGSHFLVLLGHNNSNY